MSNPCITCGKERINGKTWTEKVGNFVLTHTLTICPDPKCQKLVEKAAADRKMKSDNLIKEKTRAKLEREKLVKVTL